MRKLRTLLIRAFKFFFSLPGLSLLFFTWAFVMLYVPTVTVSSISPNGQWRISLLDDRVHFIDRNFWIVLEDNQNIFGSKTEIFRSPDETGAKARFLWSKDSSKVLMLFGKYDYEGVVEGISLTTGEDLYLLYEISSKELKFPCFKKNPPSCFNLKSLKQVDFGESLNLVRQSQK